MRKIIVIFLIFASCINPYDYTQDDSPSYLVVEGYVSDKAGDSGIKLSRSGIFQNNNFEWVTNADVVVIENGTEEHTYVYHDMGWYKPVQDDFIAKKESSYHLKIFLEGQVYESDPVNLLSSLDIDSLSFKSVTVNQDGDQVDNPRLELQLTTSIDESASRYYIYTFEETWKTVAWLSTDKIITPNFIYDENQIPIYLEFETEELENITECWPTNHIAGINTTTTEGLTRNQLVNVPVFSVSLESDKLLYRYSVLVNQYAISREAHYYFNMVKEFSESSGFLYDIQPGHIAGNIQNRSTPDNNVIGIFYAASHTSSRIFKSYSSLTSEEKSIVRKYLPGCEYIEYEYPDLPIDSIPNEVLTEHLQFLEDSLLLGKGLVISNYDSEDNDYGILTMYVELSNKHCVDCRVYGSNIEPIWW